MILMKSRRFIPRPPGSIVLSQTSTVEGPMHVRFGSEADMCAAKAMSALSPKADMFSALGHVRFGPIADIVGTSASGHLAS
jgi:hypothetical protein